MTRLRVHAFDVGRSTLAVVAMFMLASLSFAETPDRRQTTQKATLSFNACQKTAEGVYAEGVFAEGVVTCGVLHVPENRTRPGSRMLALPFTILKADAPDPKADPVLVLTGGPGGSAHIDLSAGYMPLTQLRGHRDIIVLEQRGTGYTSVPLICEAVSSHPITRIERAALTKCRDRMRREGVDFSAYDTVTNVQDFVDLGRLLGVRRWTLLANSYGTRLALMLMRDHGEGIRAAVLDAAYPLSMNNFFTGGQLQGLAHVVRACNRDPQCAANHPRLRDDFVSAIERLDENPITIRGERFGGELVIAVLRVALGRPESVRVIPAAIERAAQGDLEPLMALSWISHFPEIPRLYLAHGMYALVECRDSYYQAPPLDARETPTGGLAGWPPSVVSAVSRISAHERIMCEVFDPGSSAAPIGGRVHSAIPTLVINGEFDGGTTSEMGDQVTADLENAVHITTRGGGHTSLANPCIQSIVVNFVGEPSTSTDTGCTQAIEPLEFE